MKRRLNEANKGPNIPIASLAVSGSKSAKKAMPDEEKYVVSTIPIAEAPDAHSIAPKIEQEIVRPTITASGGTVCNISGNGAGLN
jgi:hypothetical protein